MILVIQTNGGTGKSTIAMQLMAPWVLDKTGHAQIVELDDENHDSADFTESAIRSVRVKVGQEANAHLAIDELIDHSDSGYTVADIGGNRTASMALEHLGKRGYDVFIDLIVIPVSSAGQDVQNARRTLDAIKRLMPEYAGRIVMVITRTPGKEVDLIRAQMPDAFALMAQRNLSGPLILPTQNCFPLSRFLRTTVWEIGQQGEALKADLRQKMAQARRDPDARKQLSLLNSVVTEAMEIKEYLRSQFAELDKLIDLKAAMRQGKGALDVVEPAAAPKQKKRA